MSEETKPTEESVETKGQPVALSPTEAKTQIEGLLEATKTEIKETKSQYDLGHKELKNLIESLEHKNATLLDRLESIEGRIEKDNQGLISSSFKSLGDSVVESKEYSKWIEDPREGGHTIRIEGKAPPTLTADVAPDRLRHVAVAETAGYRVPEALALINSFAGSQTTSNGVYYIRETFTNNAATQTEAAAKAQSDIVHASVMAPIVTIAHYIKVSRQALRASSVIASRINSAGVWGANAALENQVFNGDGTGGNLNGLINQATVFSPNAGSAQSTVTTLRQAIRQVRLAEYPSTHIFMNPTDTANMDLERDDSGASAGTGGFLVGQPKVGMIGRIWGLPILESTVIPTGRFLVGNVPLGQQLFYAMRTNVQLALMNEDDFIKNMATIRVENEVALCVYRPQSFVQGKVDGTAIT